MDDKFEASLQKKLIDTKQSFFQKYSSLVVGKRGFWAWLKFELITLFFSWIPGALGLFLRKVFYRFLFKKVGKGVAIGRNVTLRHPHKIVIGDNCFIDDNVVLDAKGENNEGIQVGHQVFIGRNTILSCKEGSIFLDDYCNLSANCSLLSETEIRLGKYCFLAGRCYLVAGGNHSFDDVATPIMFQPSFSKGGISIEEDVWLAAGVIVLDGITLGKGSIMGAGSVVTESFPENTIAVGAPAKRIRTRGQSNNHIKI